MAYKEQPIRNAAALFDAYILNQLQNCRYQDTTYSPQKGKPSQKTIHHLCWLAKQLKQHQDTDFLIENLQPDWLDSRKQKRQYRLSIGLIAGLIGGLSAGLSRGLSEIEKLRLSLRKGTLVELIVRMFLGLIIGMFSWTDCWAEQHARERLYPKKKQSQIKV